MATATVSTRKKAAPKPTAEEQAAAVQAAFMELPLEDQAEVLIAAAVEADSVADLRSVFDTYYRQLGWKALCRMFVLGEAASDVAERRARMAAR